jgi:hypothetical protein
MRASTKILTALTLTLFACPAFADTAPSMDGMPRLAIGGYDTVAYFTVGRQFLVVLTIRLSGMTRAGNSLTNRISISSSRIQKNMRLNMMVIAPWASHTRTATKIRSILRLSPSSTVSCM